MNSIFHYILEAESETPTPDLLVSPYVLSAALRGSVAQFFSALRANDAAALRAISWNLFLHYGRAHFDAAVRMIRGEAISTVVDQLEAAVPSAAAPRKLVCMANETNSLYLFDLSIISANSKLLIEASNTVFVAVSQPHNYPILESAPCTPKAINEMPELLSLGSLFDLTVDYTPEEICNFLAALIAAPVVNERRAKIVYISAETYPGLLDLLKAEKPPTIGATEVKLEATVMEI